MGHLGSRDIASEILERVSYGNKPVPYVDLPWKAVRMHTGSDSRVFEDSEANWAIFIVFHSLEEQSL
jgi:hypothetical protein